MEGFIPNIIKFFLFIANFFIFILGSGCFCLGIYVCLTKPVFLAPFVEAETLFGVNFNLHIDLYTLTAYLIMVLSLVLVMISFFGCCGSIKESRCMLGFYFFFILLISIFLVSGAILLCTFDLENAIKVPLKENLKNYRDQPSENSSVLAYKEAWGKIQKEFLCCGVDSVDDWITVPDFPAEMTKPEACCTWKRSELDISSNCSEVEMCRQSGDGGDSTEYYFEGCYNTTIGVAILYIEYLVLGLLAIIGLMFLVLTCSFYLCVLVPAEFSYLRLQTESGS